MKDMDRRCLCIFETNRRQEVPHNSFRIADVIALRYADVGDVKFPAQLPRHRSDPVALAPRLAALAMDVRTVSSAATTHRATAEVDGRFVFARAVRARASGRIFD